MAIGLVGTKCGMTRLFNEDGSSMPATLIQVLPNYVTQVKTLASDGYAAVQVTTGMKKASRVNSPLLGHFAKANVKPGLSLHEFRVQADHAEGYKLGDELPLDMFEVGKRVDVRAISKGKGYAGTVKRHNFRTQDATHGNSRSHRVPGSIGQNQTPGRVFKGKKMCGHLGVEQVTVQSLKVLAVDLEKNIFLVHGAVPGATGACVVITPASRDANK